MLNGDTKTGFTIMHMDDGLDTGDIIAVSYTHLDVYKRQGEPCLAESTHATDKPVSLAFYEIAEGEVTYKRTKEGIK